MSGRSTTNKKFTQLRQKLNPEQLQAVEAIEGPVMVLAGPGTGKTQVVAMRIAEILNRTQIAARNILALTFTEAGVTALRTRLEQIIGPDAYQVTISTFHAFAGDIITTFPYLFHLDDTASQLSDLDRYLLLEKIVAELPKLKALRPVKQPTIHIAAIGRAIRTVKQEAINPERLGELAERQKKTAATADKKIDQDRQLLYAERNSELADIYAAYEANLRSTKRYDYEDMILLVVEALRNSDELRLHYQERYHYMLVDEYQDTNNSQNALVEALASFFSNPNLFVVGDDKQAIYRFQGASVANMLHFTKKYPAMKIFSLRENYRSSPEIIRAATELIGHNRHQLGAYLPKIATVVSAVQSSGPAPELVVSPTPASQFAWLLEEIKNLQQKNVPLAEIAVLFRVNADVRAFRHLAEKATLPVSGSLQSNLIQEPEIQALITILRAIDNPRQTTVLLSALRSLVPAPALSDLLAAVENTKKPLLDWLVRHPNPLLAASVATILRLHQQATKMSLTGLSEEIMLQTDLLERTRARPDRVEGLELLSAFIDEMTRFSRRRPLARLKDFLEYLELLGSYNIQLTVNRVMPERGGLFVGTVHAAKGLEFAAVFLPNADESGWNARPRRSVIELPGEIVGLTEWNDDATEDDRRVFYVGLTRAKRYLYLSYAASSGDDQSALPCQFVAEMKSVLKEKTVQPTAEQTVALYQTALSPAPEPVIAARELVFIREQIRSKPFSFTDLKTYQLCPKQYLLRSVFRLPSEPTIPLVYGNAVHRALELFFRAYRSKQKLPSVAQLQRFFRQALLEQPPVAGSEALREQGERILGAYYQRRSPSWPVPVGVEFSFRPHQVMLDDIWISGKFDRLDPLDPVARTVRVVDYKTVSRPKSRNEIEGLTKTSDGALKRQLVFYAMLAARDRLFPYRSSEFVLSFIDDQAVFKDELFAINREEITALEQEVTATFQEILTRNSFPHSREVFDQGCEICAAFPSL